MQVVHESMARQLAAWLLVDGEQSARAVLQRELTATALAPLPSASRSNHLSVAVSALGEVVV